MKKIITILAALMIASSLFAGEFAFGIEGGAGINKMILQDNSDNIYNFDYTATFREGFGIEYSFNEITSLQTKVLFHHNNGYSVISGGTKTKIAFPTIEVPLLTKFTFAGIDTIPGFFSFTFGPLFSFRCGDVETITAGLVSENNNLIDCFAFGLECGVEYELNKENGFRLGLNVDLDCSSFSKDYKAHRIALLPYISYYF